MRKSMTYRNKLIGFFLLAIAITTMVGIYSFSSSSIVLKDTTNLLTKTQELTRLYDEIEKIQAIVEEYLEVNTSESLQSYYDYSNSMMVSVNTLKKNVEYTERGIKIKNLVGMVEHYLSILDNTIYEKRVKNIDKYTEGYKEAQKEYEYIGDYIQEMMTTQLSDSADKYVEIQKDIRQVSMMNYFIFGVTVILVTSVMIVFSFEITKPLSKLASYAKEVSKGNYDVKIEDEKISSEMSILYKAFGKMTVSIKNHLEDLKAKQKLENKLTQEKLNNMKMKNALHEAELLALQSQINPHFIFNTINIGSKVAMLQGDDITCNYLESAADVFRYNLKGLDYNATLSEEISNLKAYMNLLLTRFGTLIDFRENIEYSDTISNFILPRMTLQPIIENAYIHGVSKNEDGGTIELTIHEVGNLRELGSILEICISNTGEAISDEMIDLILQRKLKNNTNIAKKGHTTGIGIDNVLKRLRLFYKREDVMDIRCHAGITYFILKLPIEKRGGTIIDKREGQSDV